MRPMKARQSPARLDQKSLDQKKGAQGWAPRLAQEARLRELDARLARSPATDEAVDLEIERAVLLAALNRNKEAQASFVAILRKAPTHFSGLNEFGTLLTKMGAIEPACRVYAEAIL